MITLQRSHALGGATLAMAAALAVLSARGENWPQWRGPHGNGSSSDSDLPDNCDPSKAKWVTPLPGPSHATPAIWGDRIFLTSTDPGSKGLLGMCLSASNGAVLWNHRFGNEIKAPQNNGATPSPVTDGKLVGFLFGSGDLAVLDMDGRTKWAVNLIDAHGDLATKFGYSSSPLLWKGKLFIQMLRRTKPYQTSPKSKLPLEPLLLAYDFESGALLWKQVRPSQAKDESLEAYTSPVPFTSGDRAELLILGGDCLTGHNPDDGSECWRMEYNPKRNSMWRVVPSPAVVGGLIVATKPRGGPLIALKPGLSGKISPESATWTYNERTTDSGSPLIYQKHVFILQSDKNDPFSQGSKSSPGIFLLALDPATGRESGRCLISPGGAWRSSPTGADGKIYLMSENSEVVVASAEATPRVLSRADYKDGKACATIAIANDRIYIRTKSKLTCIGK